MNLANLIALQKAQKESQNAKDGTHQPDVRQPSSPAGTSTGPDESDGAATVPPEAPAQATPAPSKPAGLGLNRLSALRRGNASAGAGNPDGVRNNAASVPATLGDAGNSGLPEFSLDDIAALDASSVPELKTDRVGESFLDEIEATAPDRDLPADLEPQQLAFVESLNGVYGLLTDPEMFAQSVRVVMMELQENPEYIKLISDQDVHTMIRGMRNSMGLARVKKQEKSRKTGTGTKKAASKTAGKTSDALALLDSLGFGDD